MGQVSTTIKVVDKATKTLNNIYDAINKVNNAFNGLGGNSGAVKKVEELDKNLKSVSKTTTGLDRVEKEVRDIGNAAKTSEQQTNLLISKLKRLASTYLGVMGAKAALTTADTLTSANAKFVNVGTNAGMNTAAAEQFSSETMDKIFNAAQSSLSGYTDMLNNVAKSVTLAGDAFGETSEQQINNAIKFQEIMAKSYAIGGASAAEQASSMYQLVQALGSGQLQGDELRSVREGAPVAAKAIEEFAQKVTGSTKSLKEMGSEGLITSEMVVAAILNMEGQTEEAFEYIRNNMTFAQLWTQFKNNAVRAFQPFLETLREIANNKGFQKFLEYLTKVMYVLGNVANWVATQINNLFTWIGDNWSTVEPIINALIAALSILAGVAIAKAIAKVISLAASFLALNATQIAVIAIVALIVWYFSVMGVTAQSLGMVLLALGVCGLIAGIMIASPLYIIVGIILILIGLFVAFTEYVMASLYAIGAALWNIIVAAWDLILGFVELIWNAWAAFANFLGNLFNDPIAAIVGLFINLADIVLGVLETIAKAIDAIFGSNLAGTISGWRDSMNSWYDKTFEPEVFVEKFDKSQLELDRWSYSDAISQGWETGSNIKDWINNGLSGLTDFDNILNLDGMLDGATAGVDLSGIDDKLGGLGNGVDGIGKDTSDISKSMDLTEEDLKYLRQIAEMEAINKFTTAEIKVEMTNNNNVAEGSDLDGIVTHLRTTLQEELQVLANGVHSA